MISRDKLYSVPLTSLLIVSLFVGCGGEDKPSSAKSDSGKTSGSAGSAGKKTAPQDEPESDSKKAAQGGVGTLVGVIKFQGDVPELPPLIAQGDTTAKDAEVCAANAVPDESLVVNAENMGIANVFVYLGKAPKGAPESPAPTEPIILDQKGCQYLPHAGVFQVSQSVQAISNDKVAHNVHTYPQKNDAVNQIIQPGDTEGITLNLVKSELVPVPVKCDIHTWMSSYQLPLDHPYAAVSDSDGRFEIANLPAGVHEFRIWQEKGGYLEKAYEVTIKPGESTEIELEYGIDKLQE